MYLTEHKYRVLVFATYMGHVSIKSGSEIFLLGRQNQLMTLVYELSLGLFLER